MRQEIVIGTGVQLNINAEKLGVLSMKDYDFDVIVEAGTFEKKRITYSKKAGSLSEGLFEIDADNYLVAVDTSRLSPGMLLLQVEAHIDSGYFAGGKRPEYALVDTNITLIKGL